MVSKVKNQGHFEIQIKLSVAKKREKLYCHLFQSELNHKLHTPTSAGFNLFKGDL